jgi:hypothetical protein
VLRLVCWNLEQERGHRLTLESAGYHVDPVPVSSAKLITHIRLTQPAAVVIDLDRLASHGMAVGIMLRTTKSTRTIPLVFLGGDPEKVARIRMELPDAAFGSWAEAPAVIRSAGSGRVIPAKPMARFAGRPLEKKLGLKTGMRVAIIGAPESFRLKTEVVIEPRAGRNTELVICFIRSRAELEREMAYLALHPPLWVGFPKQSAGASDFNQHDVRRIAKEYGLTDNKVCAIDRTWSAIRFAIGRGLPR